MSPRIKYSSVGCDWRRHSGCFNLLSSATVLKADDSGFLVKTRAASLRFGFSVLWLSFWLQLRSYLFTRIVFLLENQAENFFHIIFLLIQLIQKKKIIKIKSLPANSRRNKLRKMLL